MPIARVPLRTRLSILLSVGALVAVGLIGSGATTPVTAAPPPHWGNYQWNGGAESADIRAFWLFDRTGDPDMRATIQSVVEGWNSARNAHPELPFIAVYQDDANAGGCFVNETAGFSVASACMLPPDIHGAKAIAARNADSEGHLVGGAFAVSEGLDGEEAFTVVCHAFGHLMGLEDSENAASCMSPTSAPGEVRWYDSADADYILGVYGHSDAPGATTTTTTTPSDTSTTTSAPTDTTTSTTVEPTTTTVEPTTTTVEPTTTTTAGLLCDLLPLDPLCPDATTTTTTEAIP